MGDELEKMRKGFEKERIHARPEARNDALELACQVFEEKKSTTRQGMPFLLRLIDRGRLMLAALSRRRMMKSPQMKMTYYIGGATASLVALSLIFTTILPGNRLIPSRQPDSGGLLGMFSNGPHQPVKMADKAGKRDSVEKETVFSPASELSAKKNKQVTALIQAAKPAHRKMRMDGVLSRGALKTARPRIVAVVPAIRSAGDVSRLPAPRDQIPQGYVDQGRDKFETLKPNLVKIVTEEPVSTFSVDVDTASYSFMRASLHRNVLPQKNAVRIEELINYFPYDYEGPKDRNTPFKTNVSVMPSPWNSANKLLHIGIKGYELARAEQPRANLVFLIDSSGSMHAANKLPLVQNAFKLLLSRLHPDDTIAIVTYAGNAGTVLAPTKAKERAKILSALENLRAGGSTAGAQGIRQAYRLAAQNYDKKAVNRVILATDGDFNVGITNREELKSFVERQRKSGVFLSVLGFGMGNYNDALMQTLAQNGNGVAAYIDNLNEARKVLVEEAGSTLFPIAKDVKIQVEFNPATVSEYRLIGFETRMLNRQDFNNDKVDAGDIGAGHTVTAIYEITPTGSAGRLVDDLRYGKARSSTDKLPVNGGEGDEYAFVKIRYKLPESNKSTLITTPVKRAGETVSVEAAPGEARFATAVAAFGQILRGGTYTGTFSYDDVIALAQNAKGADRFGYRAEFIQLVRLAKSAAALASPKRR